MAARRRMRKSPSLAPSTLAMIDVIFILFAFFLSVSQIRKSTVKVNLPEVSDAVATGEREDPSRPLRYVVHLTSEGLFGLDRETFRTREGFFARFEERIRAEGAASRGVVAEIVADRDAGMGGAVDVINFLTRHGVKRLEFLAVERGAGGR